MPESNVFDAIVVGSGISGGWAAKELTEKGLKVIMLERGRNIEHVKDYTSATKDTWEFPHRGGRTQQMIKDYPVLKRDYPLNEINLDYWAKDSECPYTEVKRFDWFRGYHVGGRSLMWGRQSYRWSDLDFEANAKEGIGTDWPIRYKEIAAWYDMTPEESWAWYESGLSAHGNDLDNWAEEAIIRYGRLLEKKKDEQLEKAETLIKQLIEGAELLFDDLRSLRSSRICDARDSAKKYLEGK